MILNCLTPTREMAYPLHLHGDNHRMLTLSRGCEPVWMSEPDAEALGIQDNDWCEVYNDHGVYAARAASAPAFPRAFASCTTSPSERSASRSHRCAAGSGPGATTASREFTSSRTFLAGGYGQFTYHFNYWGPIAPNRDTHVVVKRMDKVVF